MTAAQIDTGFGALLAEGEVAETGCFTESREYDLFLAPRKEVGDCGQAAGRLANDEDVDVAAARQGVIALTIIEGIGAVAGLQVVVTAAADEVIGCGVAAEGVIAVAADGCDR